MTQVNLKINMTREMRTRNRDFLQSEIHDNARSNLNMNRIERLVARCI